MIVSYRCANPHCDLAGLAIPDIRTLRSPDGNGRLCARCQKPMKVAETINVSSRRRSQGRISSRRPPTQPPVARPARPRRPKVRTTRRRKTTRR